MCCFSGKIESVTDTRIFARLDAFGRQFVIYAMSIGTPEDVAMILPVPIVPCSGENALSFINLENYSSLFDDMRWGFPVHGNWGGGPVAAAAGKPLAVQKIGAYEASFIPTTADFERLDKRFRLPDNIWQNLPDYQHFGFAVFKLQRGTHNVHPMAFSFPSAMPDRLFFPTLHIHDGEVHEKAEFDHTLYCQGADSKPEEWLESKSNASQFMKPELTSGIVLPAERVYKRRLDGELANTDWVVKARPMI